MSAWLNLTSPDEYPMLLIIVWLLIISMITIIPGLVVAVATALSTLARRIRTGPEAGCERERARARPVAVQSAAVTASRSRGIPGWTE